MRRKNAALEAGELRVFDAIPLADFERGRSDLPFAKRCVFARL